MQTHLRMGSSTWVPLEALPALSYWCYISTMSIGHTQMSIRHSNVHSFIGQTVDIQMSICPMDEQKCPVDIQMSIGHLAEVLDMYGTQASDIRS